MAVYLFGHKITQKVQGEMSSTCCRERRGVAEEKNTVSCLCEGFTPCVPNDYWPPPCKADEVIACLLVKYYKLLDRF